MRGTGVAYVAHVPGVSHRCTDTRDDAARCGSFRLRQQLADRHAEVIPLQKKRAIALQQAWGDKPCSHPSFAREYDHGERTGSYICTQCGATLTFRERSELLGTTAAAPRAPARKPARHADPSPTGGPMKKKSPRGIPDFSRQSPRPKGAGSPGDMARPKGKGQGAQPVRSKPQGTSSKSGQRGK